MWKISARSLKMADIIQNKYLMWMKLDSLFLGGGKIPERSYIHKEKKTHTWIQVEAISHSKNPWALKNVSKHMLPVYYCANNKALLAQTLFEDSFINCLIPSVRNCLEKGIPFKVIVVLLDNAPCHP